MKQLFTLVLILFFVNISFGKSVDEATAKIVGMNFLINKTNSQTLQEASSLQLVYKVDGLTSESLFYVFNTNNNGFIIIAGDDNVTPVLGYSYEGSFSSTNIPISVKKWLEGYKNQISYVINNHVLATREISEEWTNLKNGSIANSLSRLMVSSVNPLLQTKWDQSPYYNALCPGGSVTGCVATAMAQIMKYWNFPATGSGFHSYNHSTYGTLSANFAFTNYQWGSMPNQLTASNSSLQKNAVATLMYHAGVSVDMGYSPQASGAVTSYIVNSLKDYFGYDPSLSYTSRLSYNDPAWLNLLKAEFNLSRPVIYRGSGSGGSHCFVADGYDVNDYIHFNWGWGGYYDGFFQINALNPAGTGTGGGTGDFNSGHAIIEKIKPYTTYDMRLYNYVTPSASIINYGQGFSVTTNIKNAGTNTFNGDYCAAIFNSSNAFVGYVQILPNRTLQGGYVYSSNLTFTTTSISAMTPGTYYISMYYKPTGGAWKLIANSGSYTNPASITVVNPNSIEVNSAITIATGTTITQGVSASVNFDIKNYGSTTFIGKYKASLYDVNGNFAQTINSYNETSGLPAGFHYSSPFVTLSTPAVTVTPGTYYLWIEHNPNNTGWQLTGSSYYQSFIEVKVVAPNIQPDMYEVNDAVNQAYDLPISFSGSGATKNTNGSNFHIVSDGDYYKITLPTGYSYSVAPRLHDSYNSGNGNTYTADALFSYSTNNGSTWSEAYDHIMSGNITLTNGGVVYFHAAPYYAGQVGTYLFDVAITKTLNPVSVKEIDELNAISIYPNPAKDFVEINTAQFNGEIAQIKFQNIQGQQLFTENVINKNETTRLPLANLASGVYFLHLETSKGTMTKKIIIDK